MNLVVYLLIQILLSGPALLSHTSDSRWKCNEATELCYKLSKQHAIEEADRHTKQAPTYTSQKICRLTCGQHGALWPKPTLETVLLKHLVQFHPSSLLFEIAREDDRCFDYLTSAAKIFKKEIEVECGVKCDRTNDNRVVVRMRVTHCNVDLAAGTDESYHLGVNNTDGVVSVRIASKTVFGARHALETLSQLIASHRTQTEEGAGNLVIVGQATIKDKPVYTHRGLLIDTARNYLSVSAIKRQIDGMAASKLNVLHWHATDSQSFPFVSSRVPLLSRYGAYSPKKVYTPTDVKHLLKYAKHRGVRIVLEIDAPAHAGNGWQWGPKAGLGHLAVCVNQNPWRSYCIQPPCGQLNPANENLYSVLGDLYADIVDLFPKNETFHMGGDEVFVPCWNSSKEILRYLKAHGKGASTEDFHWLWGQYHRKALEAFDEKAGHKNTPIVLWSSALTDPERIATHLNRSRFIIQTWVPSNDDVPLQLLELGYRIILSTKDAWYLDHGFWGSTVYRTWRDVYKNQIPRHENTLGGEVCMWGELVDEHSIDPRVWPRAAAAAERLWSDPGVNTAAAEPRFYRHRERLVTRGIKAEALAPMWCVINEGKCL